MIDRLESKREILSAVLDSFLSDRIFPEKNRFRVRFRSYRETIDQLCEDDYLNKNEQESYILRLQGLVLLGSPASEKVIGCIDKIIPVLQGFYEEEPNGKMWNVQTIAIKADCSLSEAETALFFMDDMWCLGGYQNQESNKFIRAKVAVRESIFDRTSVKAFIEREYGKREPVRAVSSASFLDSLMPKFQMNLINSIEIPQILYKYRSLNSANLTALENKRVWYSTPPSLNDPHDSSVSMLSDTENKELVERFQVAFKNVGVLSLSSNALSPVMWGHYAESHKGFCMGFEYHETNVLGQFAAPVKYSDTPMYPEVEDFRVGFSEEIVELIAYTKGSAWSYEEEWRVLKQKGDQLYPYPGKLKEIIFGLNTPSEQKDKIKKIVSEPIRWLKLVKDENSYVYKIVED